MALDPKNAASHSGLGTIYRQQGRYTEAIAAYEQALVLAPKDASDHASLAAAYRKLGNEDKYDHHIALAHQSIDRESPYNQACFEAICGNAEQAIAYYSKPLRRLQANAP